MKKVLAMLLVLVFVVAACAPAAPAVTPPPAQDAPAGDAGDAQAPKHISIYTNIAGTSTYVLGVALADLINRHSDWLSATALESPGPTETASMLMANPDRWQNAIGYIIIADALIGTPPFTEPIDAFRGIATYGLVSNVYMTNNPDIRTLHDLDGRRVAIGTRPNVPRVDLQMKMFELMGIEPIFEMLTFGDGVTALSDGRVDAVLGGAFAVDGDWERWIPNPALAELLARDTITYISMDEHYLWEAKRALNHMIMPGVTTVPAGLYADDWNEPITIMAHFLTWVSHETFPDETVEEILRVMFEHHAEFGSYMENGFFITPENMAQICIPEAIHPAAERFFTEHGIYIPTR